MIFRYAALIFLCTFYIAYIVKRLMLKRRNIEADILGKGQKPQHGVTVEIAIKWVTGLGAVVQFVSVFWDKLIWWSVPVLPTIRLDGVILMLLGTVAFILAMITMKDNWRAGYNEEQNTELVTTGIYKYSRNPAFLGFDLLYIGCALAFPNLINILITIAAVILLHLQIVGEEEFLANTFGQRYLDYKAVTLQYLGKRVHRMRVELTNMIMVTDPFTGQILIQERTKKSWSGLTFPGGHVEAGESLVDSAIREAKEETGLNVRNLKGCGVIHWSNIKNHDRYLAFLYKTDKYFGELLPETREGKNRWMSREELLERPSNNGLHEILRMFLHDEYSEAYGSWSNDDDWRIHDFR